jgi:hypothetical protein
VCLCTYVVVDNTENGGRNSNSKGYRFNDTHVALPSFFKNQKARLSGNELKKWRHQPSRSFSPRPTLAHGLCRAEACRKSR